MAGLNTHSLYKRKRSRRWNTNECRTVVHIPVWGDVLYNVYMSTISTMSLLDQYIIFRPGSQNGNPVLVPVPNCTDVVLGIF
jgi:hypothetical protein